MKKTTFSWSFILSFLILCTMRIYVAIILGLIQGFTEFLPISSSGHIIIAERILGTSGGLFFTLLLHFGTLLSVIVCMYPKILEIFKNKKLALELLIATVPAGVIGVCLSDVIDKVFFGGRFIWLCFLITAIFLCFAENYNKRHIGLRPLNYKTSAFLGLAQGVAVIPAISRSGSIFGLGLILGIEKQELSDFTFLMSIPVILGGTIYEGIKCIIGSVAVDIAPPQIILGVLAAFFSGLVAIETMKKVFVKGKLWGFSLYLAILSLILFIWL